MSAETALGEISMLGLIALRCSRQRFVVFVIEIYSVVAGSLFVAVARTIFLGSP